MVELHAALAARGQLRSLRLALLRRGEKLEDALGSGGHGLHRVGHVGELLDRLREVAHVLDEALDVAGGRLADERELRAHHDDAHVAHVAHEAHERHHQAGEELAAPAAHEQAVVLNLEVGHGALGAVEHLDDVLAREVLLHDAVHGAEHPLLLAEVLLREVHHHEHDHHRDRQREHGDAGERQADGEHHHEHADDLRDGGDELRDGLVERLAERVHVVGDAAEHVTLAVAVEVAHGDDRDLLGDLLAHAVADLLRDAGHEPALDEVARRAGQVQAEKPQQRHPDPLEVHRSRALDRGNEPLVELGGHRAQYARPHDVEDHRAHGKHAGENDGDLVAPHVPQEPDDGPLEVLCALRGAPASHRGHQRSPPFPAAPSRTAAISSSVSPSSAADSWLCAISR